MSKKIASLRVFNLRMAALHIAQAVLVIVLTWDFSSWASKTGGGIRELSASILRFDEATQSLVTDTRPLFDIDVAMLVALFLAISGFAHYWIATIGRKSYENNLKKGINKFRWYEYSVSASIMMVLIAMLSGIFDTGTLLAIFGLTAVMNLAGLIMEVHNQKTDWLSYNVGVIAGIVPWLVVGIALWASETTPGVDIPTFVYGIYGSLFLFFNSFAINMVLQYKKVGKWADYLYGERVYIVLSLVAKSALAWQIYAGTLQP
jgi:hypothetical protein